MAKKEKEKKTKSLQHSQIAVHVLHTDGEESFEEFFNVAQMLYYIKKLFFEKPEYVDKVRIELS